MKYLITGSAGFLGYYLVKALSENGDNSVVAVDNFVRGEGDALYEALCSRPNVEHIDIDLNDMAAVRTLPDDIDVIYHMAALNGTQNFYERPFECVKCCTLPTIHLLDKYGPLGKLKRFVYAGSSESYASTVTHFNWEIPTGEDVPLGIDDVTNARWSYGGSKLHGEIVTVNGCNQFKIDYTVIRYHNAYGPRMGDKHVIPDFLMRAKDGVFALYGYEDTRSFIYADDVVRATLALGDTAKAANEIVNVGGSEEILMRDLGETMMKVCGFEGEIDLHPSPKGSVKRRAPKLDKLRQLTGYEPEWTLEAGIAETARFYLGN